MFAATTATITTAEILEEVFLLSVPEREDYTPEWEDYDREDLDEREEEYADLLDTAERAERYGLEALAEACRQRMAALR